LGGNSPPQRGEARSFFEKMSGRQPDQINFDYLTTVKKILVVYYSRTGITKKLALYLADKLSCDIEEIFSAVDRRGAKGWALSGQEATEKTLTDIKPTVKNPADYDLIIIGTPIWSFNVASPVRTYLSQNKDKFKKVAFFCTEAGVGHQRAFKEMATLYGQQPVATLVLKSATTLSLGFVQKEILDQEGIAKTNNFIKIISNLT